MTLLCRRLSDYMSVWAQLMIVALAFVGVSTVDVVAQDIRSPILTIDSDQLYNESAFGKRVAHEIEKLSGVLAKENSALAAELKTEELDLTDQRPDLSPDAFRALADTFDARVEKIRRERQKNSNKIEELREKNRMRFLNAAALVLEQIMRETNAAVILEQRSVFVSSNAIDITQTAIERIDAQLGDGTTEPE